MSILSKEQVRELIKENGITTVQGIQETFKSMFKDVIQEMLEGELEDNLGYSKYNSSNMNTENSRNGHSKKIVKSNLGNMELDIPRDRMGEFEPKIVPKHQRDISDIEQKVISLYSAGMSTRDIHEHVKDIYGIEVSAEMVSKITDKVIPLIQEWQHRPLEPIYAFVFMDAIHYKVRDNNQVVNKAAYVVIGVTIDGYKDVLGIWIGEHETSKFWLGVLNELKNRGVKDVLIFCVDGLNGFKEAISGTFPESEIQRCIIHQIRNSMKYVSYKDIKEFCADLKLLYTAVSEEQAIIEFDKIRLKWEAKYPYAIKSWDNNWDCLGTFFKFPNEIRKIIYTTNVIESLHRQYRKVTKTKCIFPNNESLLKMLYLANERATKKWTVRYHNWDMVINQLSIFYNNRLETYL